MNETILCPHCGKEMLADIHGIHNGKDMSEIDNWWCGRCQIILDRDSYYIKEKLK